MPLTSGSAQQSALPQQSLQQHRQLVRSAHRVSGDTPVLHDVRTVEHAEHRVGVADVNGQ